MIDFIEKILDREDVITTEVDEELYLRIDEVEKVNDSANDFIKNLKNQLKQKDELLREAFDCISEYIEEDGAISASRMYDFIQRPEIQELLK